MSKRKNQRKNSRKWNQNNPSLIKLKPKRRAKGNYKNLSTLIQLKQLKHSQKESASKRKEPPWTPPMIQTSKSRIVPKLILLSRASTQTNNLRKARRRQNPFRMGLRIWNGRGLPTRTCPQDANRRTSSTRRRTGWRRCSRSRKTRRWRAFSATRMAL